MSRRTHQILCLANLFLDVLDLSLGDTAPVPPLEGGVTLDLHH